MLAMLSISLSFSGLEFISASISSLSSRGAPHLWQIETGYRVKEYTFRGKTCSKNYIIRYFYFMLSVILYDCWVLADLLIIAALGIRTVKTTVTAKIFSAKLLTIKEPAG